jgi:hypothetical protein
VAVKHPPPWHIDAVEGASTPSEPTTGRAREKSYDDTTAAAVVADSTVIPALKIAPKRASKV